MWTLLAQPPMAYDQPSLVPYHHDQPSLNVCPKNCYDLSYVFFANTINTAVIALFIQLSTKHPYRRVESGGILSTWKMAGKTMRKGVPPRFKMVNGCDNFPTC